MSLRAGDVIGVVETKSVRETLSVVDLTGDATQNAQMASVPKALAANKSSDADIVCQGAGATEQGIQLSAPAHGGSEYERATSSSQSILTYV